MTLVLQVVCGCDADDAAPTEVVVTVTSHAELAAQLSRVRASVYESDARDGGLPVQTQDFVLSSDLDAGVRAKLPFSFTITEGRSERFLLVVEGFGSLDPAAAPVVEQKQVGVFTRARATAMTAMLSASCANMYDPCPGLAQTCWPEARACGPLREATMTPAAELRGLDASVLPSRNPPECPPDACDPNYPCVPTPPEGYVCLGARADYPMPYFGSKTPPSYDLSEPGVAVDRVTGLAWQRETPQRYEGCSGTWELIGDSCTLDEAKRYCKRLQLGGRAWRLPSTLELASLLDLHAEKAPLIDREAFPIGTFAMMAYWTSSTIPHLGKDDYYVTAVWSFRSGTLPGQAAEEHSGVRCVSGVPRGRGAPAQRFVVDAQADTVSDRATALTWQRTPTTIVRTHDAARAHCAMRGPEWRLPNTLELFGILDLSRFDPALPDVFPNPAPKLAWTETTLHDGTQTPIPVENVFGMPLTSIFRDRQDLNAYVRCVR